MIEVKDITKRYGSHTAVDHLSFRMEKGRIYGFLGPNGAGKSTTMNIMTGYIAANEGTVLVNGEDIAKKPKQAKKQIGYLPELPPLYQEMTVLEYLRFAAELRKIPQKQRRDAIARVMKMTMLGDYQDRLIRNLSKGYKQRVGLAQALIGSPEIIILDEPTVGLDPQQILEIRDLIRSLREDHIIMLSSHILSEVNEVCDEVMILSHGKLVASGSPAELESRMQKKAVLRLEVLADEDTVRTALQGVDGIREMTFDAARDDGTLPVLIASENDASFRLEVARALAAAAIPVTGMQLETRSLEDVFLELTSAEAPQEIMDTAADSPEEQKTDEAADNASDEAGEEAQS